MSAGKTRRPSRLDRESIVDAAFAVAEDAGHRGLTMRRVGAELGADPTAVYRHFRNKDELITAMADRLFGEVIEHYPDGPWREGLRNGMLMGRRVYRRHPGFAEALAATPDDTPNLERIAERVLGLLRKAGLTDGDAVLFYHLITNYVAGTGVFEAVADEAGEESWQDRTRRVYSALPPDRFPNCVALAPHMYPDPDLVFDTGVELVLDAIEARVGRAQEGASMTELHYLSATEAIARFRSHDLSPVELLDAVIARAEEVEPTVNALCHTFHDEARAQAREAEARYMGKGEQPRPLEGIPIAIKEEEAVAGQPWTQGSLIYKDLVAEQSSSFAQRILDAGRDRPRADDGPGVLVRGVHPLAHLGRHPQPVEPGVRRRRLVRRLGRLAGVGHLDAGQRLGHRRLDPRSRHRSTASSGSSRRTGACRRPRRSTSTSTATAARWRAPSPTARCSRTCSPGRTPTTTSRCARSSRSPSSCEGVRGPAGRRLASISAAGRSTRRSSPTRWPRPRRCARPARSSSEVDLDIPRDMVDRAARDPLPPDLRRRDRRRGGQGARRPDDRLRDRVRAPGGRAGGDGATMLEEIDIEAQALRRRWASCWRTTTR